MQFLFLIFLILCHEIFLYLHLSTNSHTIHPLTYSHKSLFPLVEPPFHPPSYHKSTLAYLSYDFIEMIKHYITSPLNLTNYSQQLFNYKGTSHPHLSQQTKRANRNFHREIRRAVEVAASSFTLYNSHPRVAGQPWGEREGVCVPRVNAREFASIINAGNSVLSTIATLEAGAPP